MNDRWRILLGGATAISGCFAVAASASGDVRPAQAIMRAPGQAEVQVPALESRVPNANYSAGSYRVAQLFGESDEEKAERLRLYQQEQSQNTSINYLRQRNDDLENSVRRLPGQIEQ